MDARAREAALRLVLGLGDRGDVELLPERALALLPASVADERRPCEARAGRLAEVRAGLEALRRVLPQAFPESVEHLADALCEVGADPVRASSAFVAVEAVLDELVADSRRAPPELRRDLRDGPSAPGEELNPLPFVCDHLVHCFSPFVLAAASAALAPVPSSPAVNDTKFRACPKVNACPLPGEGVVDLTPLSTTSNLYRG